MAPATLSGDPRKPDAIKTFVRKEVDPESEPMDYYSFASLILGLGSFILKLKEFAWLSLFMAAASYVNLPASEKEMRSIIMSVTLATMALVSSYTYRPPLIPGSKAAVDATPDL